MDPITLVTITIAARASYDLIEDLATGQTYAQRRKKAIKALTFAATKTEEYLRNLKNNVAPSMTTQQMISRSWEDAFLSLTPLYEDDLDKLYAIRLKSDYWKNPENWSEESINATVKEFKKTREYYNLYVKDKIAD